MEVALPRYSGTDALYEHLLSGETVSVMEAMLLFGVQSPGLKFSPQKERLYSEFKEDHYD